MDFRGLPPLLLQGAAPLREQLEIEDYRSDVADGRRGGLGREKRRSFGFYSDVLLVSYGVAGVLWWFLILMNSTASSTG